LYLAGFNLTKKDLMDFRQVNSHTPGHLEYDLKRGIEATTGPLGQGIGMAAGMAIASRFYKSMFNEENFELINNHVYVLCGDGDLQEGISHEAFSLAGHLQLNNLIILFDSNEVQLDTKLNVTQSDNLEMRMKSYN
jgi:transketolase